MVRSPVDSSMRSRQTGQVGNSMSAGVGGARGLVLVGREDEDGWDGVKGSSFMVG